MPKSNDAWGIEVGANALKAVRLVREDEEIKVDAYDVLNFKKILTTPDLDVDEAIRVNLDKFLSRHEVKGSSVVISVPGHMAFARFTKLPPVDPRNVPDIVKFEAQQQIPFRMDQVEWDYQTFSQPDSPDVEVGLFAITRDRINKHLANYSALGMTVDGITLSPLALFNAMAFDLELTPDSPGTILMDVGTSSTDVVIFDNGSLWLRTLPIGGNDFTEALVRAFKLSFRKAEKLKREAGTSKYARQIFQAMRPVFADLVQELQKTLGYYRSINRDAELERLYGFGSTFRLPGLQKFLKQQLSVDVIRPDSYDRISVEGKQAADFAHHALTLGTAYGLALQGLEEETVDANLLPQALTKKRLWKAKQPWFAAAACVILAAVGGAWAQLWMTQNEYNAAEEQYSRQIQSVLNRANQLVSGWKEVEGGSDPRQRIQNLRRILDYRDVWPKLMHDLSLIGQSMNPQSALLVPEYEKWKSIDRAQWRRVFIESMEAGYKFNTQGRKRQGGGSAPKTWDASAIWAAPDESAEESGPAPVEVDRDQLPPSFNLEIRGWTPNENGARFLAETVVAWLKAENLRAGRPYQLLVEESPMKIQAVG
ncbi:MAG: type IV pilus assembly protein PilM, partial [Phycisphaeraceae bacterium]|nr:type IV pilus assembly protein PilM [Phycisphaeraceae bacterium]